MNRITICAPAWKRPDTFERWLRCMVALEPRPHIIIAGSANDQCGKIAEHYGCDYFQVPNLPVGRKWNTAHLRAKGTADYYLTTGSDDVMCQRMWDYYQAFTGARLVLMDLYFLRIETKEVMYWRGYANFMKEFGFPIGASQLHSHETMEKLNWEPFNSQTMAHENDTERKCRALGINTTYLHMKQTGGISVDLKCPGSYSQWARWANTDMMRYEDLNWLAPDLLENIYQPITR
jgi:hypothetical protein